MRKDDHDYLKQAADYWTSGVPLEAGKLIYENLPLKSRPRWAAGILKIVLERSGIQSSQFDQLLTAANHDEEWENGHRLFTAIRKSTLELDEMRRGHGLSKENELVGWVQSLAELVAKVIYNATSPPDEFDEDSGWWIAASLRGFVDHVWVDESFAAAAWSALCRSE